MTAGKPPLATPEPEILRRMADIVGPAHALTDPDVQAPYLREWRDRYTGRTPLVLRPGSTAEVAELLKLANEARVGVVPQAGNTGLVGGQIPHESGAEVVISLARMKAVRAVDAATSCMTVEAGVTLAEARLEAERVDRLFPLSLPSEGSCCIGGNLATNAGGIGVLAYGSARALTLGLEAVFADGTIWNGLTALRKDNTGYDLKDLLIGSEGTLAIITAATLKLVPRPRETATVFVGLQTLDDVLSFFETASNAAAGSLTAFEFMSARALSFVTTHMENARLPLSSAYPWYVLFDVSAHTQNGTATGTAQAIVAAALEQGRAADAVLAPSLSHAQALWRLREFASEAQKFEGGSIKHDISVPVGAIPKFIVAADALIAKLCPGARPVAFGHFGDGNVHYNVSQPPGMARETFLAMWEHIAGEVHALVTELNGSISAEHGIGRLKREALRIAKGPAELDLMQRIKFALDPNGILNPGKLL